MPTGAQPHTRALSTAARADGLSAMYEERRAPTARFQTANFDGKFFPFVTTFESEELEKVSSCSPAACAQQCKQSAPPSLPIPCVRCTPMQEYRLGRGSFIIVS
jgi:hypothetical protein